MKDRLVNYFRAGYPAIAINSAEESRVVGDVIEAAKECKKGFLTWSATEGIRIVTPAPREVPDTGDLYIACQQRENDTIYIMRDIAGWPLDRDPVLARAFRDLVAWAPVAGSCVVVVGPSFTPHPTVEKMFVITEYTLPDDDALRRIASGIAESSGIVFNGDGEVIRALTGLSTAEAENALALSYVESGKFDPAIVYREKVQSVRRTGLLEIITPDPLGLDAVGGLDILKEFIVERAEMFRRWYEAIEFGLRTMKGILVLGPPGTGKSLVAKCIGTIFMVPILRWDVATTFGQYVGQTETKTKDTLNLADAMAPCGLWLDEIDKAFAGMQSGGGNDSGVGMRMFGQVITWMQERKKPVFLFATANDVANLPSALYRKGRFDEIFALDIPNRTERAAIFDIHLRRRKREDVADLMTLADATTDFVGAEIEAVIESAMFRAFAQKRDIGENDILDAIRRTVPLARTAKGEMDAMRKWAKENKATPATSPEKETTATVSRRKIR